MNSNQLLLVLIALIFLNIYNGNAQSVGININVPDNSAVLDVNSTSKGILVPRMNSGQRTGISLPAVGLLVFDTETESFWYRESTGWFELTSGAFTNDGGEVRSTGNHATDDFVFGSESLPPLTVISDTLMFFDKSKGAFRSGALFNSAIWGSNSIGAYSFAAGYNTRASGQYALAFGHQTEATGVNSTAFGTTTKAIGFYSLATGRFSQADAYASSAHGQYNVGGGSINSWVVTDPIFEIGIGSGPSSKENAFTVLKNGTVSFKEYTFPITDGAANQKLSTDGNGQISWTNDLGVFMISGNVVSSSGNHATDDFVFGSESLPPLTVISDTLMFFDKSKGAFRVGRLSNSNAWSPDSIGLQSFASGFNSKAKGAYSTAMGLGSSATGDYSTALGFTSVATGDFSTAFGGSTDATGNNSTAMGDRTIASGITSTAMGDRTIASGFISTAMGSGTTASGTTSTAMGDRTIASGSCSTALGDFTEATGARSTAIGSFAIASGALSFAMGDFTTASGVRSTALGNSTTAYGERSTSLGSSTQAVGKNSTSLGTNTVAYGTYSTSLGVTTRAQSYSSLALGRYNQGIGDSLSWVETDPLFEIGNGSSFTNRNNAFTVLKNGNIGIGTHTPTSLLHIEKNSSITQPQLEIVEIGADYARLTMRNDQDPSFWTIASRPNADASLSRFNFYNSDGGDILSLQGDGDAILSERLGVGTTNPLAALHANAALSADALRIQVNNSTKMRVYENGSISLGGNFGDPAPSGSANDVFVMNQLGFGVSNPTYRLEIENNANVLMGSAKATAWTTYSDARVKKNVKNITYGLTEIMLLRPVIYDHHSSTFNVAGLLVKDDFSKEIGFIAQEVKAILAEVVDQPADESKDLWSMEYEKLTPVLVKAIQEQQKIIEDQQKQLDNARIEIKVLTATLDDQNITISKELAEIKSKLNME
jgi:hypothetical protein